MKITHIVEILNFTHGTAPHVAFHASTDDIHELKTIHEKIINAQQHTPTIFTSPHIMSFNDDGSINALLKADPYFTKFTFIEDVDEFINTYIKQID